MKAYMRRTALRTSATLLFFAVSFVVAAAESCNERWAVIASEQLDKTGATDLIQDGLSRLDKLQLVDREQIDKTIHEWKLSSLTGTETGPRIKLGRAIRADRLLLLSLEKRESQEYVRLVICDSGCGARLYAEYVVFKPDAIRVVAENVVQQVSRVQQRFTDGIKQVYGVMPFVSKNLTHDYDHLQRGYSALLTKVLSLQHGVAVIEVEEAREFTSEIGLTNGKDVDLIAATLFCLPAPQ